MVLRFCIDSAWLLANCFRQDTDCVISNGLALSVICICYINYELPCSWLLPRVLKLLIKPLFKGYLGFLRLLSLLKCARCLIWLDIIACMFEVFLGDEHFNARIVRSLRLYNTFCMQLLNTVVLVYLGSSGSPLVPLRSRTVEFALANITTCHWSCIERQFMRCSLLSHFIMRKLALEDVFVLRDFLRRVGETLRIWGFMRLPGQDIHH
jgi:hypothetical protein